MRITGSETLIDPSLLSIARAYPERVITVSSRRALSQCPRRFCYRHSASYVDEVSASINTGSRWHSVLEALYRGEDHPENDELLRAWVREWDDLRAVSAPEQPFLFAHGDWIIGGVIDLVAVQGTQVLAVDHKISTGQFVSSVPAMSAREQLGVYVRALRGVPELRCSAGVISRIRFQVDPEGTYIESLAMGEGVVVYPTYAKGGWGFTRTDNGRITRAVLHYDGRTLRIEREFYEFDDTELEEIMNDLTSSYERLFGQSFRIRGAHCGYCPYLQLCQRDAMEGVPAPEIETGRLHPELMRRLG